jgi:hypothetical protein
MLGYRHNNFGKFYQNPGIGLHMNVSSSGNQPHNLFAWNIKSNKSNVNDVIAYTDK